MAIVINYICDVSGKSGNNKAEFVTVFLQAQTQTGNWHSDQLKKIEKLVHIDIAKKLNLVNLVQDEKEQPEVSLEGKLKALLLTYIDEIVTESVSEHMSNYNNR